MTGKDWRFAQASAIGTAHEKAGLPCQDAAECQVIEAPGIGPVLIAVISDGAGSASRSVFGAHVACSVLIDQVLRFYQFGGHVNELTLALLFKWLARLRKEVQALAEPEGIALREYACTMLVAIVEPSRAAFIQIGDGAMVVSPFSDPENYRCVIWPQGGEYANLTHFATDDDAVDQVELEVVEECLGDVALFTDGLQGLALHFQSMTAYAPFFRSIFPKVSTEPPGRSTKVSNDLSKFLNSPRVNERSDDDKTLIIATRR